MVEQKYWYDQEDDAMQCLDEGYAHPALRNNQPQHEDIDFELERDSYLIRLSRMQRNLRLTEQVAQSSGHKGEYIFTIEEGTHKRDYLRINEQFLKGQKKAIQAAWEDIAQPLEKINKEWTKTEDLLGQQMANEVVIEADKEFGL